MCGLLSCGTNTTQESRRVSWCKAQELGWLVARHGEGLYVYCAYAWYRQLPYAVPGAVRIFANLISLGSPEAAWRAGE